MFFEITIEKIKKWEDGKKIDKLIQALRNSDESVREKSAEALGRIGESRAVEPLIDSLKDQSSNVVNCAMEALKLIRSTHTVVPLITSLKDNDRDFLCLAILLLGETKDSRAIQPLIDIANNKDGNPISRVFAAEALWKMRDNNAVEVLIDILHAQNWVARSHAARYLWDILKNDQYFFWNGLSGDKTNRLLDVIELWRQHWQHASPDRIGKSDEISFLKSLLQLFIDKGSDIDLKQHGGDGGTVLYIASEWGFIDIVKALLNKNVDINSKTKNGWTALIIASQDGYVEIVRSLLDCGADINSQSTLGITALIITSQKGHDDILKILLNKGADVNMKAKDGTTALDLASEKGHCNVVKSLLNSGADVNAKGYKGATALMKASEFGHIDIVKILLNAGTIVNAEDNNGPTPLDVAIKKGHKHIAKLLKNAGAVLELSVPKDKNFRKSLKKLASECLHVTFQCNDSYDSPNPRGPFALAVLSDPIPNKEDFLNTQVSPVFKYRAVGDNPDHAFLFIELIFPDKKRNIVIGANYSTSFVKAAQSERCFWLNDRPFTADAIKVPIVKPAVLSELLDEIENEKSQNGDKEKVTVSIQGKGTSLNEVVVQKVACTKCGAMILPSTAEKTAGRCMPCFKKLPINRIKKIFGG